MKNTALLVFILSFLLVSCGDDSSSSVNDLSEESELSSSSASDSNEETEISSSSSSKANEKSKLSSSSNSKSSSSSSKKNKSSSSSSDKAEKVTIINKTISGMAQGPFEKGATVSVYELDVNFQQTGVSYETKIKSDSGNYTIKLKDFKSQYALLKVNGRYIDNITGAKSADSITLYAFTDLNKYDKININFLTHLSHKRILYLVTKKDKSVDKASMQAETEVLKTFNIDEDNFNAAGNIDIFGKNKQSAALLAISALIQGNLLKAKLNDRLTDFVSDIEKYGTWDNEQTKTEIADWASNVSLNTGFDKVKGYIKKWNQTVDLSAFEKYVENFWQQNYSLGECSDKNQNEIRGNGNELSNFRHFICRSNKWILDNDPANDGDTRWVTWVNPNGYGKNKSCEVYDDTTWRDGDKLNECNSGLGGCTKKRENKKIKTRAGYYICQNKTWERLDDPIDSPPTINESDTLGWKDTTEGAIRKGNTTDVIYIFNNKKWRVATLPEASLGGCNEKTVNFFGYAEERIEQDLIDPRTHECTDQYSYCYYTGYRSDYYICQKDYDNKFYWNRLDAFDYDYICNDSSYYANNKDIHWGGIDPIKCVNCKQENFDYFENICKKQCYKGRFTINALKCATDFDDCTESLLGTIKEGPTIKSKTEIKDLGEDCYRYHSYVTSIDSTNKTTYICRIRYIGYNYETSYIKPHPSYQWDVASDFDLDALPTICSWDIDGQIVVGKKNTYVCENETLRLATPVEIDAGFACTMYMGDSGNCKGEIISGKNNKYVCDESGFREATQEEIETGIACSSCIILNGLSCNTETEKEFGKTCTELKSIVEKCRTNE